MSRYTYKEMIEYGYKWPGVIPVDCKEAWKKFTENNPVLILYPNTIESYVDNTHEFFKHKDGVIYGLERNETEVNLIGSAITRLAELKEQLYFCDENGNKNPNRPNDLMDCGMIDAEWEIWIKVLNIIGFSIEDIMLFIDVEREDENE